MVDIDSRTVWRNRIRKAVQIVPKPEPEPTYPNTDAHPEFQSLQVEMGFRSVVMKQLEINERLLRMLIDIEKEKLSMSAQATIQDRYKGSI